MAFVKSRLTSVGSHLGIFHSDLAAVSEHRDRLESHMSRVDRCLDIGDAG